MVNLSAVISYLYSLVQEYDLVRFYHFCISISIAIAIVQIVFVRSFLLVNVSQ